MDIETFLQSRSQCPTGYRRGFMAIMGRPDVGEPILINHLVGQKIGTISKKAQTARNRVTGIYTNDTTQFVLVDTPGSQTSYHNVLNDRLNQNVAEALNGVGVVIFVVRAVRFIDADRMVLKQLPRYTPVILVVSRIDKDKAKDKFMFEAFISEICQEFKFVASKAVNTKHGLRIVDLLELPRPYLPKSIPMYSEDTMTDKSNQLLATEIVHEELFHYLGEELLCAMNAEVEQFEKEENGLFHIYAVVLADKDNQKAILIGKGREKLEKVSTEARLDMEKLFDTKVFLRIWVKAKSGWTGDIRFPRGLGL